MGTLGQYLRDAREARGIDLREAALQTRIRLNYLKALEEEDFAKLPGEVFVRGFLKNYGKFLRLDEPEVMKRYGETKQPQTPLPGAAADKEPKAPAIEGRTARGMRLEPFLWGAGIVAALIVFLLTAMPSRREKDAQQAPAPLSTDQTASIPVPPSQTQPTKLYLEVVALESTWLLVRTDTSPQKKVALNKGESLIWSADERFVLSYGSAGAVKLLLNGQELVVDEPLNAVVSDLTITAGGVVSRKIPDGASKTPRRKRKPAAEQRTEGTQRPSNANPLDQSPAWLRHPAPWDLPQQ